MRRFLTSVAVRRIIALLLIGLTSLAVDVAHAQSISAPSIYDDCQLACADECSWMRPRKCRRTMRKCVRKGVWVCGGLPTTTTTTLPAAPNFSAYSGAWGYAGNYQGSVGCTTLYLSQVSGTLQLNVTAGGSIAGLVDGAVAIAGGFTSSTAASVSSGAYADVYGCATTFDADVSSFTTTQGVLQLYLAQQCSGGPVCADYYVGAIAR